MLKDSRDIWQHLKDDESKRIYENRVMYSLTKDMCFIETIIEGNMAKYNAGREFLHRMHNGKQNYIFGAGRIGKILVATWPGVWEGYIDNNSKLLGQRCMGLEIKSLVEIDVDNVNVFIANRKYSDEIEKQCTKAGVSESNIFNICAKVEGEMQQRQYFDLPVLKYTEDEVFVDCGAYDGLNTINFISRWGGYRHIYCFEPDKLNREKCKANFVNLDKSKVTVIPKGCWYDSTTLHFSATGDVESAIDKDGANCVEVTSLDKELFNKRVTFIKMDIEGAELDALKGTETIIKENRPKLAIFIYHKPEDIFSIPKLLLQYHNDYSFYLRHYSMTKVDTVLYAV